MSAKPGSASVAPAGSGAAPTAPAEAAPSRAQAVYFTLQRSGGCRYEGFSQAGILRNWCSGSEDDEEDDPAGGDVQDEPHDAELDLREGEDWEDREYSAGVDCEEAMTTEWTPERPGEEVVDGQEYTRPRKAQIDRRKLLRDVGQGSQGHFHGLVLNAMPERYRMQVEGDCLFPEILSGACLEFSSTEKPAYGDFVAIYRRAQFVKPGEWQVVVKRLLVDWREGEVTPVIFRDGKPRSVGPCVEVEMLNPPKRLFYLADQIEAVHKMVRIVPEEERGAKLNAAEVVALKLVA